MSFQLGLRRNSPGIIAVWGENNSTHLPLTFAFKDVRPKIFQH